MEFSVCCDLVCFEVCGMLVDFSAILAQEVVSVSFFDVSEVAGELGVGI
jgi:hypothetical protein